LRIARRNGALGTKDSARVAADTALQPKPIEPLISACTSFASGQKVWRAAVVILPACRQTRRHEGGTLTRWLRLAITPAAAALEDMHNPADDPTIIDPLNAANIRRQMRLDPRPLLVAQPKQVRPHEPDPLPKRIRIVWNQDCVASAPKLMSFDPSFLLFNFWLASLTGQRWCLISDHRPCFQASVLNTDSNFGLSRFNFEHTGSHDSLRFCAGWFVRAEIMAISENDKHKEYAHYAAHCRYLMTAASDPDSHAIQREMAAKWLRLASAIRYPLKSEQTV
jgi:hypothetical protein